MKVNESYCILIIFNILPARHTALIIDKSIGIYVKYWTKPKEDHKKKF